MINTRSIAKWGINEHMEKYVAWEFSREDLYNIWLNRTKSIDQLFNKRVFEAVMTIDFQGLERLREQHKPATEPTKQDRLKLRHKPVLGKSQEFAS